MASIGTASRISGIGIETIRYYERAGVMPPPPRTGSGRRVYGPSEIGRLRMIRRCRDLGFPLDDVRALLALADGDSAVCSEVKGIAKDHLAEVRRKLRELAELEKALAELVRGCEAGSTNCPALNALAEG